MDTALPISFGLIDQAPVFMDLAEDSYFRLGRDEERSFICSLKKVEERRGPIVQGLVRGSKPEEWEIEPSELPVPPKRALPGGPASGAPNALHVLAVAKLFISVKRALRRQSIGNILERFVHRNSNRPHTARDQIASALEFRSARRLVPVRGNCLSDSIALMRWLAADGDGATLVFGVKLDPFAAHCWVQSGDMLLNDRPERVERFSPIRIIPCTPAMQ